MEISYPMSNTLEVGLSVQLVHKEDSLPQQVDLQPLDKANPLVPIIMH